MREYQVEGPIAVNVSYYRAGADLFFAGQIQARTEAACARCAEEFDASSSSPFRFVLSPRSIGAANEHNLKVDDLEFSTYDGDEVRPEPPDSRAVDALAADASLVPRGLPRALPALRDQPQPGIVRMPRRAARFAPGGATLDQGLAPVVFVQLKSQEEIDMQAPKRRTSHSKKNQRRSHDALRAVNPGTCASAASPRCRIMFAGIAAPTADVKSPR